MGREFDGTHRTTFLIDENNVIIDVITKVDTKEATEQIKKTCFVKNHFRKVSL
ncbi:MAG: hypothetical protein LRY27_01535 [Chitinophagales bacterium]|nr:hypothetical protein [Chitinophagales bacterium]